MITDEPTGRFVRWQSATIRQFGYAINLILALSVAALGFQLKQLLNEKFHPVVCEHKLAFLFFSFALVLLAISAFVLFVSVGLGIWGVINRLRDFRATARIPREEMKQAKRAEARAGREMERAVLGKEDTCDESLDEEESNERLDSLRDLTNRLGKITWCLFWWQIGTFGGGIVLGVLSVVASVVYEFL